LPISSTIAVICDFDDTLGEDSTELLLKEILNMNDEEIKKFWNEDVGTLVKKGWDPPLAYVDRILYAFKKKDIMMKNDGLRELGAKVRLFPGVINLVPRLEAFVNSRKELQEAFVRIEFYVISGGFEEIIRGTPIAVHLKDIFGCTFAERKGMIVPKGIVTFTEKTKFLYAINKGISGHELRRNPFSVNDVVPPEKRRIPFSNMIYIGDGPTDIPCFTAVQTNRGKTVGILKSIRKGDKVIVDKKRAWAIAKGERTTLGPFQPNYEENSDLYTNLKLQIERVGLDILDSTKRE
jgi:2-hydroxy-3-keto-5-methylthiopentenyl-1-phosphate phosphatase